MGKATVRNKSSNKTSGKYFQGNSKSVWKIFYEDNENELKGWFAKEMNALGKQAYYEEFLGDLPEVLNGCETWQFNESEENKLRKAQRAKISAGKSLRGREGLIQIREEIRIKVIDMTRSKKQKREVGHIPDNM